MRVVVYHAGYGCDTGCCGHVIELNGEEHGFEFIHPDPWQAAPPGGSWLDLSWEGSEDGDPPPALRAWVEKVVTEACGAEHVADIDWSACFVSTE